jgi:hypothetical protein
MITITLMVKGKDEINRAGSEGFGGEGRGWPSEAWLTLVPYLAAGCVRI